MTNFFTKTARVTCIPTSYNFAQHLDSAFFKMKNHLNTSRVLIITLFVAQLLSAIVVTALWCSVIKLGAELEEVKLIQESKAYYTDGHITLAPLVQIGGENE